MALHFRKKEICRAKGKLYIRIAFSCLVDINEISAYTVPVCDRGKTSSRRAIAEIYPFFPGKHALNNDGPSQPSSLQMLKEIILVVPFLETPAIKVILEVAGKAFSPLRIDLRKAKIISALNHRLKANLCHEMSNVDEPLMDDRFQLRLLRFLEGEHDTAIWRMDVSFATRTEYELNVFDGKGNPLDFKLFLFESQELEECGKYTHRDIYSLEVPYSLNYFSVVASDRYHELSSGFCSSDGRFYETKRLETWEFMRDACSCEEEYRDWFESHRATPQTLKAQREENLHLEEGAPCFSIVVPCFESSQVFLSQMIESVVSQSYAHWELILVDASSETGVVSRCVDSYSDKRIKLFSLPENLGIVGNTNYGIYQAKGDWIAFLDHDDILESDALFCYAKVIVDDRSIDALFCDEDTFEEFGSFKWPVFKSELNYDLLYSYNCVTHFLAVKKDALDAVGLSQDDVSGAQDYDLTLRLVAARKKIHHIPRMLYHWRSHAGSTALDNADSKPYAQTAGRIALQRYFKSRGIAGKVEDTAHPFIYRMQYDLTSHPLVSIIIPNKDHIDELDACLRSIIDKATYREFEIIVVENNSEDDATFGYYRQIQDEFDQVNVIRWIPDEPGYFNYSALINFGVEASKGECLLLLNNDTEVISCDFLEQMLGLLERKEVGVVGAKLFFRDGLVQHAGIEVGPFDKIVHVNQDFTRAREGYRGRATRPGNFSAVTGACQMVRREVFDEIGGYDEQFAVGFNDADFCMRAYRSGYLTVFCPYAELYHYEFTSRGREVINPKKMIRWEAENELFHARWADYFTKGDPFTNPNLSLESAYYAL